MKLSTFVFIKPKRVLNGRLRTVQDFFIVCIPVRSSWRCAMYSLGFSTKGCLGLCGAVQRKKMTVLSLRMHVLYLRLSHNKWDDMIFFSRIFWDNINILGWCSQRLTGCRANHLLLPLSGGQGGNALDNTSNRYCMLRFSNWACMHLAVATSSRSTSDLCSHLDRHNALQVVLNTQLCTACF